MLNEPVLISFEIGTFNIDSWTEMITLIHRIHIKANQCQQKFTYHWRNSFITVRKPKLDNYRYYCIFCLYIFFQIHFYESDKKERGRKREHHRCFSMRFSGDCLRVIIIISHGDYIYTLDFFTQAAFMHHHHRLRNPCEELQKNSANTTTPFMR